MDSVFAYENYRDYLKDLADKLLEDGTSIRGFLRDAGIKSPSYLKETIQKKRNLTVEAAKKIAQALNLKERESQYLCLLVKLDLPRYKDKSRILDDMRALSKQSMRQDVQDSSIYDHWLHSVLWVLADVPDFEMTVENVSQKMRGMASKEDIKKSIEFLRKKKLLIPTHKPNAYKQADIYFTPSNDIRRIDIQRSHLHYLDLAKHRINDDVKDREFQGLTIAIERDQFPVIKEEMRKFVKTLENKLDAANDPQKVIRIQCCAFEVVSD